MIRQLLEVDGPVRILRGMNQDVPLRGNRKVALSPPFDFVKLTGVGDGKHLSCLQVAVRFGCRSAHEINDTRQLLRNRANSGRASAARMSGCGIQLAGSETGRALVPKTR